ncbi:MAG TPA: hypothetical protein ENN17_10550 [bacterium]|nr:hypothetical protein [bacterium]
MTVLIIRPLFAQGYGGPLSFQGLERPVLHSAAGRAMGGVAIGTEDIGLMFQNPATLHAVRKIQLSAGGFHATGDLKQEQHYAPVRYFSNLSLLLEGLTGSIPDPDPALPGFTAQDTVQRPYDDIGPNWSRTRNRTRPLQAMLAVPVSVRNIGIVAGIGAVQYADLDHYYQNNNVLSPSILSQRPLPTLRPTDDNPVEVAWWQSARSREGSIWGYGVALAGNAGKTLSLGFSGMILRGSSEDVEWQVARGRLTFFSNAFRADSVYGRVTRTGTSDFSGTEFTLSGLLTGRYVRAGITVKLPTTLTRDSRIRIETDTSGTPFVSSLRGSERLKLPLRGTVGLSLSPRDNLTVGLEYEVRPYASAEIVGSDGTVTSPWLSASLFRAGVEYRIVPWLALRGGMRGEAEVFEPEGNHIPGEPAGCTVYSAGFGLFFSGLRLDITYENYSMNYQDIWATAVSKNSERRHALIAQLSCEIP